MAELNNNTNLNPAPSPAVPSSTITASGNSGIINVRDTSQNLRLQLNVTAVSGTTPSLTVTPQDSIDGGVTWNNLTPFTAATAVGRQVLNVAGPYGYLLRFNYAVSGTTPSFTFQIDGIAR